MEKGLTMAQLAVGQVYSSKVVIKEDLVRRFAETTGDYNPLHLDEQYAKETIFQTRVAHGMLLGGILSGVLGTQFPGAGTIHLSQSFKFLKPVLIGDEITLRITVLERIEEKNRVRMQTLFHNQRGQTVITGEALVMPPS